MMKSFGMGMIVVGMSMAAVGGDAREPKTQTRRSATPGAAGAKELRLDLGNEVTMKLKLIVAAVHWRSASAPPCWPKVRTRQTRRRRRSPGRIHSPERPGRTNLRPGPRSIRCCNVPGTNGGREATSILLDGQKATFEAAIQPGRKASVTYVKVSADDLWVWKVDVTSAAK